jgi:two-component system chemotaxis response regulator CheB
MPERIKLLIVDDSALMRKHMRQILEAEGDFELAFARNGQEALEQDRLFQPDVISLDVNMPELDGLSCLQQLMARGSEARVVMVSSLTERGAEVTLRALELGAIDFVPKPDGTVSLSIDRISALLVNKLRAAARVRPAELTACATGSAPSGRRSSGGTSPTPRNGPRRGRASPAWSSSASPPAARARWRRSCRTCRPTSPTL